MDRPYLNALVGGDAGIVLGAIDEFPCVEVVVVVCGKLYAVYPGCGIAAERLTVEFAGKAGG